MDCVYELILLRKSGSLFLVSRLFEVLIVLVICSSKKKSCFFHGLMCFAQTPKICFGVNHKNGKF